MGWKLINSEEVKNNSEIKFFSHIQNPDIRHTKGVVEVFKIIHGEEEKHPELIAQMPHEFLTTIISAGCFDHHSQPISFIWKDLLDKITWIPLDLTIDGQLIESEILTDSYLAENNLPLLQTNGIDRHETHNYRKKWYKIIDDHKEKARTIMPLSVALFTHLNDDIVLYNSVIDSYRDKFLKAKTI